MFGELVEQNLSTELRRLLELNQTAFNFGLQGPDLLFFRKAISHVIAGTDFLHTYGSRMHTLKIDETMSFMKAYTASKQDSPEEYHVLCAYYLGFICHYYLDKTVHPYVYFLVESMRRHHPQHSEHSLHIKIESEIDSILYELLKKESVMTFSVKDHYTLDPSSKHTIAQMYSDLLDQIFHVQAPVEEVEKCFRDLLQISSLLYDKTGIVGGIGRSLGKKLPQIYNLTNQFKPLKVAADTANFSQNLWHHVKDPTQKSRKSVLTLFQEAKSAVIPVLESSYAQLLTDQDLGFDTALNFKGEPWRKK